MTGPRLVLHGASPRVKGLRWESDVRLRIGRSTSLEVVIDDPSVSRQHAEITHTPRGWLLRDLGSRNGTYLNKTPVKGDEQLVRANDLLTLGEVRFRVAVADTAPAGPAGTP